MVMLPLLIDQTGGLQDNESFRNAMSFVYRTISHGKNSLIEVLKTDNNIKNPFEYINFYGLRTSTRLKGVPKTEEIYVHSKLMIIDDDVAIIGSANINDRSLLGGRDAELAVLVEDQNKIDSIMDGKAVKVGKFALDLRIRLFMEHFGLEEELCRDPLNVDFQNTIMNNCKANTAIYRDIFKVYPDDNVITFKMLEDFRKERHLDYYDMLHPKIKGHAVEYPLKWLSGENLEKINGILPAKTYT